MSNIDQQLGLRPLRSPYGTAPKITEYTRSTTGVIYEGAVLAKLSTGPVVYNGTTAAQGINILGVAAAYCAASETAVPIFDDPGQLFVVQADDNSVTTAAAAIEAQTKYVNLVSNTVGNTTTLQAKTELDASEITNTYAAHDVLQIVGLYPDPSNDVTSANEKWVVKFMPTVHVWTGVGAKAT
jgi:hypothetical protein